MRRGRIRPCKWYSCCPIKRFTEAGRLNRYWIENYCLVGSKSCIRYQMEERGEYHPDAMLPNGEIREDLS
ncbi:MAG: uracil-DNA glycosylase [Spirochaetes bacterium]|nr:uracil-DNA glycosylase [Spirochaetota bacterium]